MSQPEREGRLTVRQRVVSVDFPEYCRLLVSRRRLERDWASDPVRPRIHDAGSGVCYELRSPDPEPVGDIVAS